MKTKKRAKKKKQQKLDPFEQAFQKLPVWQQQKVEEKTKKKVIAECRKLAEDIIKLKNITFIYERNKVL